MKFLKSLCLMTLSMYLLACKGQQLSTNGFVYYVPETNQVNCVVGMFCMYANECLDVKIAPWPLQTNTTELSHGGVIVNEIPTTWNRLFPTNQIHCLYNNYEELKEGESLDFSTPYMWVGQSYTDTNKSHACLVYFSTDSVTFKHFVYWPDAHTNYTMTTNYQEFFRITYRVYTLNE